MKHLNIFFTIIILSLTVIPLFAGEQADTGLPARAECYCGICISDHLDRSYLISCGTADQATQKLSNQSKIIPATPKLNSPYSFSSVFYPETNANNSDRTLPVEIPPPRV